MKTDVAGKLVEVLLGHRFKTNAGACLNPF